ncbi:MAG: PorT family protein [Prevotellaceae bacterium]|jgi:hypothetical protein|nr:PorT family protein [Prevotellaceae bacterium]
MKKCIIIAIALLAIGYGSASAQAVWGGRIGLSRPTVSSEGYSVNGKFGVELGPVLYYTLKENFYLNSGAMFSLKAFDFGDESLNMYYMDIPLYAGYSIPVNKLSLYAQAGPFMGIKLAESEESGLKNFNAGLGIMAGINLKRFKVELGYQAGLLNVVDDADFSARLSSLFIGVSYVF